MVGGFPDSGEGRYAQKLPYESWIRFNNAQRVHQNFVESLPVILTYLSVGGLFLPKLTLLCGVLLATMRPVYAYMYVKRGGDARKLGAITGSGPLYAVGFASFVIAVIQAIAE